MTGFIYLFLLAYCFTFNISYVYLIMCICLVKHVWKMFHELNLFIYLLTLLKGKFDLWLGFQCGETERSLRWYLIFLKIGNLLWHFVHPQKGVWCEHMWQRSTASKQLVKLLSEMSCYLCIYFSLFENINAEYP